MKTLTPIRAIRAKCMDCCCYSAKEVRLCPSEDCPLHSYRMGHRPTADAGGTDEADEESEADDSP